MPTSFVCVCARHRTARVQLIESSCLVAGCCCCCCFALLSYIHIHNMHSLTESQDARHCLSKQTAWSCLPSSQDTASNEAINKSTALTSLSTLFRYICDITCPLVSNPRAPYTHIIYPPIHPSYIPTLNIHSFIYVHRSIIMPTSFPRSLIYLEIHITPAKPHIY